MEPKDAAFYTRTTLTEDEAARQDRAHGALTQATRELADAQLRTEVDLDEVAAVTGEVQRLTERLRAVQKDGSLGAEIGPDGRSLRNHGNTVTGLRNPFACLDGAAREVDEDRHVHHQAALGALYEGPPGMVHGGVTALVLDQVLGEAAAIGGAPGMTGRLTVHYRRPTHLGEVSMSGWIDSTDGRKSTLRGELRDADGQVTAEAEGLFVLPRWATDHPAWQARNRVFE